MTKNEFMNAIANDETLSEELREFAAHVLQQDAEAKAKRAATPSKARVENEALLREVMLPLLSNEPRTATELAEQMGVKTPKATAVAKVGVELGLVEMTEVKVPKHGTVKAYSLAE